MYWKHAWNMLSELTCPKLQQHKKHQNRRHYTDKQNYVYFFETEIVIFHECCVNTMASDDPVSFGGVMSLAVLVMTEKIQDPSHPWAVNDLICYMHGVNDRHDRNATIFLFVYCQNRIARKGRMLAYVPLKRTQHYLIGRQLACSRVTFKDVIDLIARTIALKALSLRKLIVNNWHNIEVGPIEDEILWSMEDFYE